MRTAALLICLASGANGHGYMTKPKWFNNWNVSNVEDMEFMFNGARSFNQPLNNWDVSKVTDMRYMFCFKRYRIVLTDKKDFHRRHLDPPSPNVRSRSRRFHQSCQDNED